MLRFTIQQKISLLKFEQFLVAIYDLLYFKHRLQKPNELGWH